MEIKLDWKNLKMQVDTENEVKLIPMNFVKKYVSGNHIRVI